MTHSYQITGMTCSSCKSTVESILSKIPDVQHIYINLENGEAKIDMSNHIDISTFQSALAKYPKYTIQEKNIPTKPTVVEKISGLQTYKPLFLIFIFITVISCITAFTTNGFMYMLAMNYFMAAFFIVFSFFKFLDIKAFAESYAMYDFLAKKWHLYGFIYPFIELALGLAYLTQFQLFITNIITIVVMAFSSIGVIKSVMQKRKIRCACLGAVFNLPMSTITIVEDLLMIVMASAALVFQAS